MTGHAGKVEKLSKKLVGQPEDRHRRALVATMWLVPALSFALAADRVALVSFHGGNDPGQVNNLYRHFSLHRLEKTLFV